MAVNWLNEVRFVIGIVYRADWSSGRTYGWVPLNRREQDWEVGCLSEKLVNGLKQQDNKWKRGLKFISVI